MISLKNEGLIDLDVIKIMGVSVKEKEDSIGMFGTGLKYAIAVFLREGIDFQINRGGDVYTFEKERKVIRGKEFYLCRMFGPRDSVDLPFTTDLGKNWDIWQAYREIHSNCLDENGTIEKGVKSSGDENYTTFYVDIDIDIDSIFLNKHTRDILFVNKDIEIYEGKNNVIFYKGIKAKILSEPSIYTYNIKKDCTLTEDRLLCYDHQVSELIANTVSTIKDKDIIKSVVTANKGTYENGVNHCYFSSPKPSSEFNEVIKEQPKVNHQFKEYAKEHAPKPIKTEKEIQSEFILNIKEICDNYNVDIDESDTSSLVLTLSGGILNI